MNIKITVRRKLPICGDVAIVCNNSDYTVIWELDGEWDGYDTKTMRTVYKDGTYADTVFTGNTVALPVVTVPGTVEIGLYAGDIRTSRAALIRAFPSITSDGGAPAAPSEDVYNQLMELIKQMETVSPEDIAKAVEDYLTEHPAAAASMRVEGGYIQFSADGKTWDNVIALADLKGEPGADGITPHIGDNGNWYLGDEDTGKPSRGAPGAKGDPGKDGAGMDITGATVGQLARISAVDDNGVPTAWEPADMPSGGGGADLRWIKVASVVTEEETNVLSIGTDFEGREISGYHALGMIVSMTVPADSTQTSANGSIWTYPSKSKINANYRYIQNIVGWKTAIRSSNFVYFGISGVFSAAPIIMSGNLIGEPNNVLSGVYLYVQTQGDHLPVGTKVNVAVLSTGWSE